MRDRVVMISRPASTHTPDIHLPTVTDDDLDEVDVEVRRLLERGPEISVLLSKAEAERTHEELMRGDGPFTHAEILGLIVPITETLFEGDVADVGIAFHVQLILMCGFPSIPESLVVQAAFGRRIGEQQYLKIVRLANRAERRGLTIDEYVEELRETNGIEHDRLVQMFLGETRRAPDDARLRRAIAVLRRTAALAPEALRPPLFCAIGWMQWARGRRAIALNYVSAAVAIEPANILARGLTIQMSTRVPEWVHQEQR